MSLSRHFDLFLATDGKWYVELGWYEHHWNEDRDDFDRYGPFGSEDSAHRYVADNFSNPGGSQTFADGKRKPPSSLQKP